MIKLKNILSEEKKFKARSADTGKIVYYKSKENMDKALDAGEAEPLQKGDEKGAEKDADDGKVKGSDLFKSKETDKVAKASPSTDATIDDYEKIKYTDKDGKNKSVSAWIAKAQKDDNHPAKLAYQKELDKRKAGSAKGDDSGKGKADFGGDYGKAADYSDEVDKQLKQFMPKPPTDDGGWREPEAETSFDDFDEDGNAIYTMYIEDPANDNYYDKQLKVDKETGEVSEVPGSDTSVPDYDGAKFDFDRIFPEDDESIKAFQDIEDKGTVEDMEDYISSYADEELLQRYGIRKPEQIKKLAQQVMGEGSSSKLTDIISEKSKGLWANIHARRKSGKRMRKKGEKGAPSDKNFKSASENINAGYEVRKEDYDCFMEYLHGQMQNITEAEYQGRKVKLNKPTRGDSGKFKVYVKNPKGNVVKVNFGAKGKKNRIKKSDPGARASFRARHNCDSPGPKHKARYWSCRNW